MNNQTIHFLKTEQPYFQLVEKEVKRFEVRFNDRNFNQGDFLFLAETEKETKQFTGDFELVEVTFLLDNERFCKKGFIVMSIDVYQPTLLPDYLISTYNGLVSQLNRKLGAQRHGKSLLGQIGKAL